MSTRRRYRSTVACLSCRQRKVRCSVTVTGVPCVGCAQDGAECIVQQRRGLTRRGSRSLVTRQPAQADLQVDLPSAESTGRRPSPSPASTHLDFNTPQRGPSQSAGFGSDPHFLSERHRNLDEERSGAEIATAALGQGKRAGRVPFYTGEPPGYTSVLDICTPPPQPVPRHILIPSNISISLSPQDREYLQYKGVFTLPQNEACQELLRAYFHHVHPIMPVVDATLLLKFHHTGGSNECNLLLVWSIFFVAVNFIPADIWKLEGYSSRKEMKDAMYSRAKCMYDCGGETDQTVRLQSALLMAFWHSEMDEHTQPWYWTGIAISLCQIMGLHRDPDSVKFNPSFTDRRRHLWRRLWWSCFFRDRWLSLTLGRPLRINLNDCDTPMPSAADMMSDLAEIPDSISRAYIPNDLSQLAEYWIILIWLSKLLGDVLALSYQPFGPRPTIQQVESLEAEILQFQIPDRRGPDQSRLATFYHYHLQLHYQAFLITFYRPYVTKAPEHLPSVQKQAWQSQIRNKIDSAALQTNTILDNLAREKLLGFAGPMTPPLLVPAMHIHLLNCKTADPLSRRLGLNKLDLCMMVMGELQETYTAASVYRGIFLEAIRQLYPNYSATAAMSEAEATDSSVPRAAAPDDSMMGPMVNDDVIDALMDDVSIFNLWESLTRVY